MKKLSILVSSLLFCLTCYGQQNTDPPLSTLPKDTLILMDAKTLLNGVSTETKEIKQEVLTIKTVSEEIAKKASVASNLSRQAAQTLNMEIVELKERVTSSKQQAINSINESQLKSVRACIKLNMTYAPGAKSVNVILKSLLLGTEFGKLSSPFVSPQFENNYEKWTTKWGKFLPAVILPVASMFLKNENAKIGSVSTGLALTTIFSALSGTSKSKNSNQSDKLNSAFNTMTSTMDLFDFNRMVYSDLKKLDAAVKSIQDVDSKLADDYYILYEESSRLLLLGDKMVNDTAYAKFIDRSMPLIDRFQEKLNRINYVFDFASGLISSYPKYQSDMPIVDDKVKNEDKYQSVSVQTNKGVKSLQDAYTDHKEEWISLQSQYFKLKPKERRDLELFLDLEDMKKHIDL